VREPIMRIYDAHRDLHHNMHVCPEAEWVGCLIACMSRDAEPQDPCSCDGGGAITHHHNDATCTGGHDSYCFPEDHQP
jgi:hypothetical protein